MQATPLLLDPETLPADAPVGGKARALASLTAAGFPVPTWRVLMPGAPTDGLAGALREAFPFPDTPLAVRSSAADEDGTGHSFAGQLDSFLNVPCAEVAVRVADVWRSGAGERVQAYRRERGLSSSSPRSAAVEPAVIVQRMVAAVAAGVAFGADPVTGRRGVAVVSAVRGLGDALVSGERNADTFEVDRAGVILSRRLATPEDGPVLDDAHVRAVADLVRAAGRHFGCPQDVEWAFDADGKLWLLQSRPVTALAARPEADGAFNLWDNANIAESYGGVTTPLTFSFARRVYEEVYRQFCRLMGVAPARIEAHEDTFRRMLGLIRGRVYYNLLSWHRVLALLPGYRFNRGFMEGMMGVKEPLPEAARAELAAETENSSSAAGTSRFRDALDLGRSLLGLVHNLRRLPRTSADFQARLDDALREPSPALEELRADELVAHYRELERKLLRRWDAPLVNDFFAMIFFGTLRRLCERWCGDRDGTLPNELLAGDGNIISAEPARRVREMAAVARDFPELVQRLNDDRATRAQIERAMPPAFVALTAAYLERFGDRCLEELKLETPTLRDDPRVLYRAIGRLAAATAASGQSPFSNFKSQIPGVAGSAEKRVANALRGHPFRRWVFARVLLQARARVRARENLRFERTRVFGRVRRIFVELGHRFHAADRLDAPRDVFHLTVDEALGFVDGTVASADLRGLVRVRRVEFDAYRTDPPPAERFETRGTVHVGNLFTATPPRPVTTDVRSGDGEDKDTRRGLPCCAGVVRGRVRVVLDPRTAEIHPGEILVAPRTDPGWILLFPAAAGLLVEHGSLLSHSAIVSRELGLPAVVSIPGLTAWLRTGDEVEFDGATGQVRRLKSAL